MNNGYLIPAISEAERRQAVALAYSIRIHNPEAQVSLVVGELGDIEQWEEEPFDTIIEYPFAYKVNPRSNDWQLWWVTPYENTIVMDSAMIVSCDMQTIWDYCIYTHDIVFPGTIKDFRGDAWGHDERYTWLEKYNIQPMYTAWFFFKKTEDTMDYFKLGDPYMQNYIEVFNLRFEPQHVPKDYENNIMHGVIANDSARTDIVDNNLQYTDMDLVSKMFEERVPRWTDYLNVWVRGNGTVKIQNFANTGILYYKEPDFLTEDIFNGQRNTYRVQTKVLRQV